MQLHILGICGTFMAGVALLGKERGYRVTGSDQHAYPPMSDLLSNQGIEIIEGYDPAQLENLNAPVVVGNVMRRGLPIVEALLNSSLEYTSGPQWLYEKILKDRRVIAVAGTHGKTTTSSMLAWILEYAGLQPGFLIGGIPQNFGVSARLGKGEWFVVEADEYDTAFFDKRSKFVHYRPEIALLNNLEFDHADIFPDIEAIQTQFHHLVRTVPSKGHLIVQSGERYLEETLERGCWTPITPYSTRLDQFSQSTQSDQAGTGWSVRNISPDMSQFDLYLAGEKQTRIEWALQGVHNMANGIAAVAAAAKVGVSPDEAAKALGEFQGVKRRMELKGEVNGVAVYDDFAHHPTAIEETLRGAKARFGDAPLRVALEMRTNTLRMGVHHDRLPNALTLADSVHFWSPAGSEAGLDPLLKAMPLKSSRQSDIERLVDEMATETKAGDVWIIMSQGGFGGLHQKFLARLKSL